MEEVWEICFNASKVGMIGTKYAMQPSGAGYKVLVSSHNNCHEQSKGENEVKWIFHNNHITKSKIYFNKKIKWIWSWIILV